MWCLVNRKARIVIFYEDTTDNEGVQKHGGRNRNVLKELLVMQKSNHCRVTVITYICILTTQTMDIDYLCCLAHAEGKVQVCLRPRKPAARIFLGP